MSLLLTNSTGLNTIDRPSEVVYNAQTGVSDLIEAVNIDISDSGAIDRTDGYLSMQSGNFHSLFCEDGMTCLVGKDTSLYAVNTDYSLAGVRSGLTGNLIDYCQAGDPIFYTNGTQNGMVINQVSYPWIINDHAVSRSEAVMQPVPVAQHLDFAFGRIFFSIGNGLYWTELGLLGLYSPTLNHVQFGSRLRMFRHVDDGMFVSDSQGVYFLEGKDPHAWILRRKVANYPAYEWGICQDYVDGKDLGLKEQDGLCTLWNSPQGVCLGTSQGYFYNLTKKKIVYPIDGHQGACGLRGFTLYNSII